MTRLSNILLSNILFVLEQLPEVKRCNDIAERDLARRISRRRGHKKGDPYLIARREIERRLGLPTDESPEQ